MRILTAKQNQKFPFHFLSAPPTPPAEENKKGKENFWFLLPRPKGADEARRLERTIQFRATTRSARAIQSSSGFSSKYIRTLFNTHRQNSEFKFPPKIWSARSAVCSAFPPKNSESERIFHAPRGSSFTNTNL